MKSDTTFLLIIIAVLLGGNVLASSLLGLGDAEALYYCYARHPSLSYLDHPPLIGWLLFLSTSIGGASVFSVRVVSLTATALSVVFNYCLTKEIFGNRAAIYSTLFLAATPVFSIGMIAATPDSALAVIWPLFTWQLYLALKDMHKQSALGMGRAILLGALLGLAFLSKYTGICLMVTSIIVIVSKKHRCLLRTHAIWISALIAAICSTPVIVWNFQHDFAGLYHRLVWTQSNAGFSLRNFGALLGGQILYVGPFMLVLLAISGVWAFKHRKADVGAYVIIASSLPALFATYLLSLWSNVAEPHWPAVAYMPLFAAAGGLVEHFGKRAIFLAKTAIIFGFTALIAMHILVLTPLLPAVTPKEIYKREYDLANELQGWPKVARAIKEMNADKRPVVAAFYTQCSQLFFALDQGREIPVGCVSKEIDDYDFWYPGFEPPVSGVIFVNDNRFDFDYSKYLPGFRLKAPCRAVTVERAGIIVRVFEICEFTANA